MLAALIESVTIHPAGELGPEAEVVAKVADLVAYAAKENTRPGGLVKKCDTVGCGDLHRTEG